MHRSQFSGPARGLESFVRFYVQREIRIHGTAVAHPVPARATPMIVFDFDDRTDVLYCNQTTPVRSARSVVVGVQTYRRLEMQLRGSLDTFVIMFHADGLHRLFSVPMNEMTDLDMEAHSVLGNFITKLGERLGNAGSFAERVRLTEEALLARASGSTGIDGVSAVARGILSSCGRVDIPTLAARAGLSMRQLERKFTQQVGVRPKLFARIARFEAALENKARFGAKSWTEIAHDFGYYDQMHMVHDFAEFTGGTPTETLSQLETVFVEQIKAMRSGGAAQDAASEARLIL